MKTLSELFTAAMEGLVQKKSTVNICVPIDATETMHGLGYIFFLRRSDRIYEIDAVDLPVLESILAELEVTWEHRDYRGDRF